MKKFLISLLVIVTCCVAFLIYASNTLLNIAFIPEQPERTDYEACFTQVYNKYPFMKAWNDSIHADGQWRDTVITVPDGTQLHGVILQHKDSLPHGTMMMIHGYTDNAAIMLTYLYCDFESLGHNVLVPERRGHGFSDGDWTNFGWIDRLDMHHWLEVAHSLWPDTTIVVHGLSMGAATTMMLSGDELPDSLCVSGFVEDCGYTSTWDELNSEIYRRYSSIPHWLGTPLLWCASRICEYRYGFSFEESSAIGQVAKCEKPMLFIHGDNDDFVPSWMGPANYEAKTHGYRDLWVTKGSVHAHSIHDYYDEYVSRLDAFLSLCEQTQEQ